MDSTGTAVIDTSVEPVAKPIAKPATAPSTILGAATAEPAPMVGEGFALNDGWINTVAQQAGVEPESLKTLSKFKDVASLAKSYAELDKMRGKKGVQVPTEASSLEEREAFYQALGRPDTPDGYTYEGEKTELYTSMAEIAHKNGIPDTAWKELVTAFDGSMESMVQGKVKTTEEATVELKREWGFMFNKNIEKAQSAMEYVAKATGIDSSDIIKKYGNDTAIVKMLSFFGDKLMEDGTVAPAGDSAIALEEKIKEIRASDAYRRGDKSAQDQLYAMMKKKLERETG